LFPRMPSAAIRRFEVLANQLVAEKCASAELPKTKSSPFTVMIQAGKDPEVQRLPGPHNDPEYESGGLYATAQKYWEATGDLRTSNQGHLMQQQNALKYADNATTNYASPMQDLTGEEAFLGVKIVNPKDAKRILRDHVQKPIFYQLGFLGHGLLGQENNNAWQQQRKHLKPAFTVKSLAKLMPIMAAGASSVVEELNVAASGGQPVDIWATFHHIAFLLIGHSAIGEESEWLNENAEAMQEAFKVAIHPATRFTRPEEFKAAIETMNAFSESVWKRAEGRPVDANEGISVASLLLDKSNKGPYGPNPPGVHGTLRHDELMNFMFAGHETTANTMSWAMYELAQKPDYQERCAKEISDLVSKYGKPLDQFVYRELNGLRELTKMINETLRMWPVVANGPFREMAYDDSIRGGGHGHDQPDVVLKKGTFVQFPHYTMHRSTEFWGPDADEFNPDRKFNMDAFMPFTRPPRDCIGRNFAMMEMRCILAHIIHNFTFQLTDPDLKLSGSNEITLRPEGGVLIVVKSRGRLS
jgi:cytokinin trans-hydroxylase